MITMTRWGRRASDQWLGELLAGLTANIPNGLRSSPAIVYPTTVSARRPRRTKAQLKEALTKAIQMTQEKYPLWIAKRIKRHARNLVRLYKVA